MTQNGFTLWFTGLSGSGKSTNSYRIYIELKRRGLKAELLDGDIIRTNFSQGLGFSKTDRDINIRRIGFVSYLLNKNDIISIVAAISPYEKTRVLNRKLISSYIEVFCDCPLDVLEQRDPKGLYRKAMAGEIANFTGISDPYEAPADPDILLDTSTASEDDCFRRVIAFLENKRYIPCEDECELRDYSPEEELQARRHLVALGFASKLADL
ncbi:MAG: adenylyl-sulfate kinase [Deltaproteobacteria bacterium]|nr:adenylyl-sulfate kinase [Deltaproteobacteria bacterium]